MFPLIQLTVNSRIRKRIRKRAITMTSYEELKECYRKKINDYLKQYAFFAFNEEQYTEGLKKLHVTDPDDVIPIGAGGYMLQDQTDGFREILEAESRERSDAIADPINGLQFATGMFKYELNNHEYSYTGDITETIEALGYSLADIDNSPRLKQALQDACSLILQQE